MNTRHSMWFFEADPEAGSGGGGSSTLVPGEQSQQAEAPKGWVGEDGNFTDGWLDRLPDDIKEARGSVEKYKNFTELVKGHHNATQLIGKKANAVVIPNEKSTPEEIAAYRKAAGVPDTVDGYQIKPENLPEGFEWDDARVKPVLDIALKHNVSKAALAEMVAWDLQREQARVAAVAEAAQKHLAEGDQILRKEWGSEYDANLKLVTTAAKKVGIDPTQAQGFADPQTVLAFAKLAKMISDDKFVQGGDARYSGSGDPAKDARDIMTNPENSLYKAYQEGDESAREKVHSLLKQANPK